MIFKTLSTFEFLLGDLRYLAKHLERPIVILEAGLSISFWEGVSMSNLVNPTLAAVLDENPEIRSFIYQQIVDFENYVTPETMVSVMAKDPLKLKSKLEAEGETVSSHKLSKMFRISIVLKEDETKLQEEGLHEDIFEAIKMAKSKLIKKLEAIQDQVISQQERIEQINQALTNPNVH